MFLMQLWLVLQQSCGELSVGVEAGMVMRQRFLSLKCVFEWETGTLDSKSVPEVGRERGRECVSPVSCVIGHFMF